MLNQAIHSTAPTDSAAWLAETASTCNGLHEAGRKTILELGELLEQAKAELGHGRFAIWVQMSCSFSPRTAQRYMATFAESEGRGKPAPELVSKAAPVAESAEMDEPHTFEPAESAPVQMDVEPEFEAQAEASVPHSQYRDVAVSSKSPERYTPPEVVDLAYDVFEGAPDLDPASCEDANNVVKAQEFFNIEDDGLTKEWRGKVFLNWPGGRGDNGPLAWAKKLVHEYVQGHTTEAIVLLYRHDHTTEWHRELVKAGADMCLVSERLRFWHPTEDLTQGSVHPSSVAYIGNNRAAFAEAFRDLGAVIPNALPRCS